MHKIAVLFDLDGTILDTIEDLKDSLNHVLDKYGFPGHSTEEVKRFVGNGMHKLVERAVPEETSRDLIEEIHSRFISYYKDNCRIKTKPYPGIMELVRTLKENGIKTAVISNKSDAAVRELTTHMFNGCFDQVLGASDGVKLKPDRAMIDIVLGKLSVNSEDAIYVGDSEVDIETARNAHMDCVSVTWGFRSRAQLIANGAEMLADEPAQILRYI